jgi:hypothetical protein
MPGLVVQETRVFNVKGLDWKSEGGRLSEGHVRTGVISHEVVACEVSEALFPLAMRIREVTREIRATRVRTWVTAINLKHYPGYPYVLPII